MSDVITINYQQLLTKLKNCSEFASWQMVGTDSSGLPKYRDNSEKNPHLELSRFGLYDFKTGTRITLPELAKTHGISDYTAKINKGQRLFQEVDCSNEEARLALGRYLELGRGLKLGEGGYQRLVEVLEIKFQGIVDRETGMKIGRLIIPAKGIDGKVVQTMVIDFDWASGKKITKKSWGSVNKGEDFAILFGKNVKADDCRRVLLFEGLENALCWNVYAKAFVGETGGDSYIVTQGTGGFKRVGWWLDVVKERVIDGSVELCVVCDSDTSLQGLKGSMALAKGCRELASKVVRYYPNHPDFGDLNDAVISAYEKRKEALSQDEGKDKVKGKKLWEFDAIKGWFESLVVLSHQEALGKISDFNVRESSRNKYKEVLETISNEKYLLHKEFFLTSLFDCRKDLFSGQLMVKIEEGSGWEHYKNAIEYLKGVAKPLVSWGKNNKAEPQVKAKYDLAYIAPCMELWAAQEAQARLLIDIPNWDGRDRLREITDKIQATDFTSNEVYELFKSFCARAMVRVENSEIQNHFLLLVSNKQGLGKDVLIDTLFKGLGYYYNKANLDERENSIMRQMSEMIVGKVSEFDKIPEENIPMIKDLITTDFISYDQKYIVGMMRKPNRTSFIGSANTTNLLKDPTGNRRYMIIEVDNIEIARDEIGVPLQVSNYPGDLFDEHKEHNRLQLLAQFQELARAGDWILGKGVTLKLRRIIESLTPETPENIAIEVWKDHFMRVCRKKTKEYDEKAKFGMGGMNGGGGFGREEEERGRTKTQQGWEFRGDDEVGTSEEVGNYSKNYSNEYANAFGEDVENEFCESNDFDTIWHYALVRGWLPLEEIVDAGLFEAVLRDLRTNYDIFMKKNQLKKTLRSAMLFKEKIHIMGKVIRRAYGICFWQDQRYR